MGFTEDLRGVMFWSLDAVKNSRIRKHVKDLEQCMSNPDDGRKIAEKRLQDFIEFACNTTEFYKQFSGKPFKGCKSLKGGMP